MVAAIAIAMNPICNEMRVPYTQAALGATFDFETLDGKEPLEIPRGTASGTVFRLRGKGVPHLERRARGDLLVTVVVDVPTELSEDEEELVRRLPGRIVRFPHFDPGKTRPRS